MRNLKRGERFKDARIVHNQNGKQSMHEVYNATGISPSMIKDLEDDENDRKVGYDKVAILAKHYGVSTDYLLELSDIRCTDPTVKAIVQYTGLPESTVCQLHNWHEIWGDGVSNTIAALVEDLLYHNVDGNRGYQPILNLLNYFLTYQDSGMQKIAYSNGHIQDRQNFQWLPSNAIALDDTIIENAVLAEIQYALKSLKANLSKAEEE